MRNDVCFTAAAGFAVLPARASKAATAKPTPCAGRSPMPYCSTSAGYDRRGGPRCRRRPDRAQGRHVGRGRVRASQEAVQRVSRPHRASEAPRPADPRHGAPLLRCTGRLLETGSERGPGRRRVRRWLGCARRRPHLRRREQGPAAGLRGCRPRASQASVHAAGDRCPVAERRHVAVGERARSLGDRQHWPCCSLLGGEGFEPTSDCRSAPGRHEHGCCVPEGRVDCTGIIREKHVSHCVIEVAHRPVPASRGGRATAH